MYSKDNSLCNSELESHVQMHQIVYQRRFEEPDLYTIRQPSRSWRQHWPFQKLTTFTTVASNQLSMISFQNILDCSPSLHEFRIPKINSKLFHLFILATTQSRSLLDTEMIQHTMNVYAKILQLESWAQWVRNKIDSFEDGNITQCQTFMNSGVLKFNQIIGKCGSFSGSITTVQQDIVAMVATATVTPPPKFPNAAALYSKNSAHPSPSITNLLMELHSKLEKQRNGMVQPSTTATPSIVSMFSGTLTLHTHAAPANVSSSVRRNVPSLFQPPTSLKRHQWSVKIPP